MNIQLIHGHYEVKDAVDILTQMIHVKIKFHESKIMSSNSEEDNQMREKRIKQLQDDLSDIRKYITSKGNTIDITSDININ